MLEDIIKKIASLDWNLKSVDGKPHPFINLLNETPPSWLEQITLDYLTNFDETWDFENDGPLGIIEVKQDINSQSRGDKK